MTKKRNPRSRHLPAHTRPSAAADATFSEAERLRHAAEQVREAAELRREKQEVGRQHAESARHTADDARHALVESIRDAAASLGATLDRMTTVEETRRTLHEIRGPGKRDRH